MSRTISRVLAASGIVATLSLTACGGSGTSSSSTTPTISASATSTATGTPSSVSINNGDVQVLGKWVVLGPTVNGFTRQRTVSKDGPTVIWMDSLHNRQMEADQITDAPSASPSADPNAMQGVMVIFLENQIKKYGTITTEKTITLDGANHATLITAKVTRDGKPVFMKSLMASHGTDMLMVNMTSPTQADLSNPQIGGLIESIRYDG